MSNIRSVFNSHQWAFLSRHLDYTHSTLRKQIGAQSSTHPVVSGNALLAISSGNSGVNVWSFGTHSRQQQYKQIFGGISKVDVSNIITIRESKWDASTLASGGGLDPVDWGIWSGRV